jgi:hypothetical protein
MNRWRSPSLARAFAASRVAAAGGPAAPSFVAASTATAATFTVTVDKPTGLAEDDVMLAVVATDDSIGITATGWTLLHESSTSVSFFSKVAGGAEPANYTFTGHESFTTAIRATIVAYRGADPGSPVGDSDDELTTFTTSHDTAAITPVAGNSMIVVLVATIVAGTTWTEPDGMDERSDQGATLSVAVFDVVQADTSEVSKTATSSAPVSAGIAIVALTPAGA